MKKEHVYATTAFLLLAVTFWLAVTRDFYGEPTHSAASACAMAEKFVKENGLKAPATADFGPCAENDSDTVSHVGEGEYIVSSYVDAQNSFGAQIRTRYVARLKYEGDRAWRLLDLQMDP